MASERGRPNWKVDLWDGSFSTINEPGWYWEDRDFLFDKRTGRLRDWNAWGVEKIPGIGIVLQHKLVPRDACRHTNMLIASEFLSTEWEVGGGTWSVQNTGGFQKNSLFQSQQPTSADAATEHWEIMQTTHGGYGAGAWDVPDPMWFPANPHIAIGINRLATPPKPKGAPEAKLPVYYTEVHWGGMWCIRFEKWRKPTLQKFTAGMYHTVKELDFNLSNLYKDEGTDGYEVLELLTMDNALVLRFGGPGAAYEIYRDNDTKSGLCSYPLMFRGNGGAAGFQLMDVRYNTGLLNYLELRTPLKIPYLCDAAHYLANLTLAGVTVNEDIGVDGVRKTADDTRHILLDKSRGNGTEATYPTTYDAGTELSGDELWGERSKFYLAIRLWSIDGSDTPILKAVYGNLAARVTANTPSWVDVSARVLHVQGQWEFDRDTWQVRADYDLLLSNRDGYYSTWGEQVKRVRIMLGNFAPDVHALAPRLTGIASIESTDRDLLTESVIRVKCKCLLYQMDEDKCDGAMPDYGGMKVIDAVKDVLLRHGIPATQFGIMHDTNKHVPDSHKAVPKHKGQDTEREQEAGFRPERGTSFVEILEQLRKYEYNIIFFFDAVGLFNWMQYPSSSTPIVFSGKDADGVFRSMRSLRRPGGHRQQANYVQIEGKDRLTGDPIVGMFEDRNSIADDPTAANYMGYRVPVFEQDETLNSQRHVDRRAREVFRDKATRLLKELFEGWADNSLFPFFKMDPVTYALTAWHGVLSEDMGITGNLAYWCTAVEDELDLDKSEYQQSYNFARWVEP